MTILIAAFLSAGLIAIDQLLKWWVVQVLMPMGTLPIWQDVLHLTYHENYGSAFGMLQQQRGLLIVLAVVIIMVLALLMWKKKISHPFAIYTTFLILAGGLGNLIDRIFRGYVVDFIDFRLINFPIFNFADCCVVVGTILLAIYILFFEGKTDSKKTEDSNLTGQTPPSQETQEP